MKINYVRLGLALLFLILMGEPVFDATAQAASALGQEQTITWVVSDWPPVYILQDGKTPTSASALNNGRTDIILKEIIANLPQYHHQFTQTNLMRTWASMQAGLHQCDAASFKNPEREKLAYFTPVGLGVAVGVVVRKDRLAELLLNAPSLSLTELVTNRHDLSGYLDAGRSFGPTIDAILSKPNVQLSRQVESNNGHLLQLLDAGRMDYTLENPIVVEYLTHHLNFTHQFTIIPIDEVPPLLPLHIACPRNEWGKQAINDIAVAVSIASHHLAFRNAYFAWLGNDLAKKYHPDYDAFFNALGKKPEPIK